MLEADELVVEQQLQCDRAEFRGGVSLRGAEASMVSFNGATFRDPMDDAHVAFNGDGLRVRHDLFLERVDVTGTVRLSGAHVAVIALEHARFTARPEHPVALAAEGLTVDRGVLGSCLKTAGALSLCDARDRRTVQAHRSVARRGLRERART